MKNYAQQIEQIKAKLLLAAKADKTCKVFGASSHRYFIDQPVKIDEITAFEQKYAVSLPTCYTAFVLEIGNGGKSYSNAGAGPFYGIYKFGENSDELIYEDTEKYLKSNCILSPNMTDGEWDNLIKEVLKDDLSDDDYKKERGKLYGGILPLGSQGCSYLHGLVLNGEYKGKVVNLDLDYQKPKFTFEEHFLDWYERWLDEVICGDLLNTVNWFGYTMGGTEEKLIEILKTTTHVTTQKEVLIGLLNKKKLTPATLDVIVEMHQTAGGENATLLLELLTNHKYKKWN